MRNIFLLNKHIFREVLKLQQQDIIINLKYDSQASGGTFITHKIKILIKADLLPPNFDAMLGKAINFPKR